MRLNRLAQFAGSACMLFCVAAMHAQQPHHASLPSTIRSLLADPKIEGAHFGISVTQLDGTPIDALDDDKLFEPASNTKLFTTAAALDILGPKQTWKTTATVMAVSMGTTWAKGDVLLRGEGDAFLSDRTVPYNVKTADAPPTLSKLDELAIQIAHSGLKKIDGNIVASSSLPWEPYGDGWNNDDLPWGYGAPVTGIDINENQLKLTISPGSAAHEYANLKIEPDFPYYTLESEVITVDGQTSPNIQIERDGRTLHIFGTIGLDKPSDVEEIAIDDPGLYTALAFKALLAQHGVIVNGTARAERHFPIELQTSRKLIQQPLSLSEMKNTHALVDMSGFPGGINVPSVLAEARHESPPLLDDVIATNKDSLNLHAELLLRKLANWSSGKAVATSSTIAEGARVVRQFAIDAGVKPNDFFFVDGSGLSTYDLVTPRAITQLLRYAATQPWGADYKSSLPIGGVDGTLEHRFTTAPLKGNVFAKTGTLSEERALSGYVVCASGRTVVFSILVGQHLPGSSADRDVMDKIVAAIAAAN